MDMRNEFIKLLEDIQELSNVTCYYKAEGLPGGCGSMDVVHVKWSNCPSCDLNCAKGKEGYPTLAFQCITDFNCCILGWHLQQQAHREDGYKREENLYRMVQGCLVAILSLMG